LVCLRRPDTTAITRNLSAGIMFVPQLSAKVVPLLCLGESLFA
jgi:hypothetical protein